MPGQRGGSQDDLKRHIVCLNRADGKLRWSKEVETRLPEQDRIRDDHGYASSTPVSDGERVYVFFGRSGVVAMDFDGKQLWHADVGDGLNGWGSAASPVLHENLVIVNGSVESSSLYAFDKATGREVWRARGIRESWNTPVLVKSEDGKTELVVAIMGKVLGFDPASGEQLWSCSTDIGWYMVPSIVADGGIVYCIGGRSGVAGLAVRAGGRGDVTRTHRLWTSRKGSNVSSPIYHDGHLYWANDSQGIAFCADAKTGDVVYEQRLPRAGQFYASPLLADGRLYYLTRDGRTFVLAAKPKFEQLALNQIGERGDFNAGLVAADGKLYLRSNTRLYCIAKE
jgi:outer membrane protein assembly factor BamB